jgi:hypothetical protein
MSFFTDEEMAAANKSMKEKAAPSSKELLNAHTKKLGKKADVSNKASQPKSQAQKDKEYYNKRQAEMAKEKSKDTRSLESLGQYEVPKKQKKAGTQKATKPGAEGMVDKLRDKPGKHPTKYF